MSEPRATTAAHRFLTEFQFSAAIETANADLCDFIMAAAHFLLAHPEHEEEFDELMDDVRLREANNPRGRK
jgi:hypothetical protein